MGCLFICEHIQASGIQTAHIFLKTYQLADIFTKALVRDQFHLLLNKLGIINLRAPTSTIIFPSFDIFLI